eukprot:168259-Pleurochrysis_carterae.AAC.1
MPPQSRAPAPTTPCACPHKAVRMPPQASVRAAEHAQTGARECALSRTHARARGPHARAPPCT